LTLSVRSTSGISKHHCGHHCGRDEYRETGLSSDRATSPSGLADAEMAVDNRRYVDWRACCYAL
jgi:hypothetical protein